MATEITTDVSLRELGIVIVTYQPDLAHLASMLNACSMTEARTIVIDNASSGEIQARLRAVSAQTGYCFLANDHNEGLPRALNEGVRQLARDDQDMQVRYLLFLDQDSDIRPGIISGLLKAFIARRRDNPRLGGVGPAILDSDSGRAHGFHRPAGMIPHRTHASAPGFDECETLNCSGMLTSLEVFLHVGGFMEELFIDHLDTEWSFRARDMGYELFGVPEIRMGHRMGQRRINNRLISRWPVPYRSPLRHYYYFRNVTLLRRLPHIPNSWRFWSAVNLLRLATLYLLISGDERLLQVKMMWKGLSAGRRGESGPAPHEVVQQARAH